MDGHQRRRLEEAVGAAVVAEAGAARCWACGKGGLVGFFEVTGTPTQSCVLLDDAAEAVAYPVGDVLLGFCERCGFIQNVRFDAGLVDYSKPTEESQAFSGLFQGYVTRLADELVDRYRLRRGTVLEVGCGKGDFLFLLSERGLGRGIGIDPGFLPERASGERATLEFIRDWYDEAHVDLTGDLVVARHLLEHLHEVGEFVSLLRRSVAATPGAALFVEVPDVRRVLGEHAFWDVYYEHCSYFSLGSLGRMLRSRGFMVESLELAYGDQYLHAEAVSGAGGPHGLEEPVTDLAGDVVTFAETAVPAIEAWRRRLADVTGRGSRVALWGGGSKAVAFLAATGLSVDDGIVVDINPHKQGKYLPGTGHRVEAPEFLAADPPDLVVVMNRIYEEEIRSDLAGMGLVPEVAAL